MASPSNSSGLLQVDNDASGHTFNAGFTFTAGRDAVVTFAHFASAAYVIATVTVGGTAATLVSRTTGSNNKAEIWLVQGMAGGTSDIVLTYSNGTDHYISGSVDEYAAGVLSASALDTATPNSANGSSATPAVSTAATTSQASTMIYAVVVPDAGSSNNGLTGPTGWTVTFTEQDSNTHEGGRGARIEETSAGVKTATFGMNSNPWYACIAAFKLAASGVSGTVSYTNSNDTISASGEIPQNIILMGQACL